MENIEVTKPKPNNTRTQPKRASRITTRLQTKL